MTKRKAKTNPKRSNAVKRRAGKAYKAASDTKTQACLDLLLLSSGATIADIQKITGWQPHSVRGFLAGTVKKKLGRDLSSTKEERGRVYRIATKNAA